jgi:hypothetical protein
VADYSDLFRQNPQLFAQVMASLSGAVGSSAGAEQPQPPSVEAQQAPPPVETPPPVEPMPAPAPPSMAPPVQAPPVEQPPAQAPPAYGALEPGNIDLTRRPHVQNEDGSVSTVRSMGVNIDGKEVLIPTVSDDGRIMSDDEAVDEYKRTGRHLGVYASPEASTAAAEAIHRDQEANMPENTLEPAVPSGATGPVDMRVVADATQPTGSLGQQQAQLLGEDVAAANEAGDSFAREGDAKALAASEAAKIYGAQAGLADRYAQAAEKGFNDHQSRAAHYRQLEDEDYKRLQEEPPKPGHLKNIFNVITGIIGAAAGGEQGAAIGMLRQHVNRQAEEDAQERAAAERRIEVGGKIQDRILRDSANEFDAASKLVAGQWIVAARQLEQVANESNVPAFREQALRLSTDAKQQARNLLKHNVETQVQQAEATRAAEAKARAGAMRTKWDDLTQPDLEALQRANMLPVAQAERLARLQKAQREAAGDAGKPTAVVSGRQVANPEVFRSVRDVDISKFRDTQAGMDALEKTLGKLDKLLEEHGTEAFGEHAGTMDALTKSATGTIKDIKTLGTLDNGLLTFAEGLLGDPTSLYKTGGSVRARIKATRESLREELEAKAEAIGLGRKGYGDTVEEQAAAFGAVPLASSGGSP